MRKKFTYVQPVASGGRTVTVEAHYVTFEPSGHVVFWWRGGVTQNDRIVVAMQSSEVNQLQERPASTNPQS